MTSPAGTADDVAVIIPAAGAGVRLGPGAPKALRTLRGEPLLAHAARRVAAAESVGCLVVAVPAGHAGAVRELVGGVCPGLDVRVVAGGAQRQQSVSAALRAVPGRYDIVLVHDAARALAPPDLIMSVAAAVRAGPDAVIPVMPVVDTVTQVSSAGISLGHLDREVLRAVQTPQGFRRAVLDRAHAAAAGDAATDDAGLVARLGVPIHTVPGSDHAFKITRAADLAYAEALLAADRSA